ncbi:MAG: DUF4159 domain-containing protein [Acidobacteriota bacterium]
MTAALRRAVLVALIVALAGAVTFAQRGRNRRPQLDVQVEGNTPYDGRFVFVRLKYNAGFGRWGNHIGDGGIPWSHDYPDGEIHFSKILEELTLLRVRTNGSNILALDDPELFNYPIAYMAEPGYWGVTPTEATAFRAYLLKGGFAIFDDFRGQAWDNLQYQMKTVLPDANWIQLDGTSRVFHSFFEIPHPESLAQPYGQFAPTYWGLFEKNDPAKRLMAIANVDNDISEYWEFSDQGVAPVDLTNEAYKFGVNYVIYGLTH